MDLDLSNSWVELTSGKYNLPRKISLKIFSFDKIFHKNEYSEFNSDSDNSPGTSGGNFWGDKGAGSINDSDIFTNPAKLPTAVSSILHRIQNLVGFDPINMSPDTLGSRFMLYLFFLEITPYFSVELISENSVSLNGDDPNYMFDCLVYNMGGVDPEFKNYLKQTCYSMAESTFSSKVSDECMNLFCQSAMDFHDPDNAAMYLYYTGIYMHHDASGKHEVSTQSSDLYSYRLNVNRQAIVNDSNELLAIERKSVDDWLHSNSSPSSSSNNLCFSYAPYKEP
jgi:hypothetical protein